MSSVIWPVGPQGGGYTFAADQDYGWRVLDGVDNFHYGLDFGRPFDTPIVAVAGGVVIHKVVDPDENTDGGNEIRIDHGSFVSGYKHMKPGSHAHLSIGSNIWQGAPVGRVAATGASARGNHLHLDIYIGGSRVDPQDFILNNFGTSPANPIGEKLFTFLYLPSITWKFILVPGMYVKNAPGNQADVAVALTGMPTYSVPDLNTLNALMWNAGFSDQMTSAGAWALLETLANGGTLFTTAYQKLLALP